MNHPGAISPFFSTAAMREPAVPASRPCCWAAIRYGAEFAIKLVNRRASSPSSFNTNFTGYPLPVGGMPQVSDFESAIFE